MIAQSRLIVAAIVFLEMVGARLAPAQSTAQLPPAALVASVIQNELSSSDTVRWRYLVDKEVDGKQETREVVETKSGSLDRLILVAGKPLSGAEQHAELERILEVSHSPQEQRKLEEARRKDMEQCTAILKMIPAAFLFEYSAEPSGGAPQLRKLTFKPKPGFRPASREGKVLHEMAGEIWVDPKQQRLATISGQLLNEVKFGGGLLGHLEKGGRFQVQRAETAPGQWETVDMDVNMRGKALFFKTISVQQKERHHDFERVPANLTMADAAALLMKQSLVARRKDDPNLGSDGRGFAGAVGQR
jgi:hypothetical protein